MARAQELGLDVIVTDHHLPAETVPDCIIVNPNQKGCGFQSKNLAGVGVIFYVLMALRAELRRRNYFSRRPERAESGRSFGFGRTRHRRRCRSPRPQQPYPRVSRFETDAFG